MSITRRVFLRNGALALVGTASGLPLLTQTFCEADDASVRDKRLVVIFQRGAADGLNIVVPHGEGAYYAMRPSIGIPRSAVLDLDGFFGLHPALSPLLPLWNDGHLAIIDAVGSPHPSRYHFEAQDFVESGTPGVRTTQEGWLSRTLDSDQTISPDRVLPRSLSGVSGHFSVHNIDPQSGYAANLSRTGAEYPRSAFGVRLRQVAELLKSNLGLQIASVDIGGWDHHVNEGSAQGQIATLLHDFSQSLAAFWTDLGDLAADTVIVTMSEFGRSVRENQNGGTDHGYGNVMFVMGGPVKGGKVYGHWPGLDQSQLYEGRDLAVTTDFREVLGEVILKHMRAKALGWVFPGFSQQTGSFLNFLV